MHLNAYLKVLLLVCLSALTSAQKCSMNPCLNNGKCIEQPATIYGYSCNCVNSYTGLNCQYAPANPNSGSSIIGGYGYQKPSGGPSIVPSSGNNIPNSGGNNKPNSGGNNMPNSGGNIISGGNNNPGRNNAGNFPNSGGNIVINPGGNNPNSGRNLPGNNNNIPNSGGNIIIGGNNNIPGRNNYGGGGNIYVADPCVCLNGGICKQGFTGYRCQCLSGFTGDQCHLRTNYDGQYNSTGRRKSPLGWLLGTLLPLLFFCAVIGFCVYCCCCRNRNRGNQSGGVGGMFSSAMGNFSSILNRGGGGANGVGGAVYAPKPIYTAAPMQDPEVAFRAYPTQSQSQNPPEYSTVVTVTTEEQKKLVNNPA